MLTPVLATAADEMVEYLTDNGQPETNVVAWGGLSATLVTRRSTETFRDDLSKAGITWDKLLAGMEDIYKTSSPEPADVKIQRLDWRPKPARSRPQLGNALVADLDMEADSAKPLRIQRGKAGRLLRDLGAGMLKVHYGEHMILWSLPNKIQLTPPQRGALSEIGQRHLGQAGVTHMRLGRVTLQSFNYEERQRELWRARNRLD
jgi:hypothetical protein